MKHKRFSGEQIVAVLKQAEAGLPVAELIHMFSVPGKPVYGLGRRRRVPDASQEAFYEIGLTRCSYWRFVVGGEFGDRALRLARIACRSFTGSSRANCIRRRCLIVSSRSTLGAPSRHTDDLERDDHDEEPNLGSAPAPRAYDGSQPGARVRPRWGRVLSGSSPDTERPALRSIPCV